MEGSGPPGYPQYESDSDSSDDSGEMIITMSDFARPHNTNDISTEEWRPSTPAPIANAEVLVSEINFNVVEDDPPGRSGTNIQIPIRLDCPDTPNEPQCTRTVKIQSYLNFISNTVRSTVSVEIQSAQEVIYRQLYYKIEGVKSPSDDFALIIDAYGNVVLEDERKPHLTTPPSPGYPQFDSDSDTSDQSSQIIIKRSDFGPLPNTNVISREEWRPSSPPSIVIADGPRPSGNNIQIPIRSICSDNASIIGSACAEVDLNNLREPELDVNIPEKSTQPMTSRPQAQIVAEVLDLTTWDPRVEMYNCPLNYAYDLDEEEPQIATLLGARLSKSTPCRFNDGVSGKCWKGRICPYDHPIGNAEPVKEQPPVVLPDSLGKQFILTTGTVLMAEITHVNDPSDFYMIPKDFFSCDCRSGRPLKDRESMHGLKMLSDLKEKLGRYISVRRLSYQTDFYEGNQLVACHVARGDNPMEWHRGVVLKTTKANLTSKIATLPVQLIDDGYKFDVPFLNCASLPKKFTWIPPLAYRCRLAGLVPIGHRFARSATIYFNQILLNQDISLEVRKQSSNQDKNGMTVFDGIPYLVDLRVKERMSIEFDVPCSQMDKEIVRVQFKFGDKVIKKNLEITKASEDNTNKKMKYQDVCELLVNEGYGLTGGLIPPDFKHVGRVTSLMDSQTCESYPTMPRILPRGPFTSSGL